MIKEPRAQTAVTGAAVCLSRENKGHHRWLGQGWVDELLSLIIQIMELESQTSLKTEKHTKSGQPKDSQEKQTW